MTAFLNIVILLLIVAAAFLLTHKALPWVFVRVARLLGFRMRLSPIWEKRISRFRMIKRGYYSFLAITTLFVLSFFLELIINNKPLAIYYSGRFSAPAVMTWVDKALFFTKITTFNKGSDFGQLGDSEVDYRLFARTAGRPEALLEAVAPKKLELEEQKQLLADTPAPDEYSDEFEIQDYNDMKKVISEIEEEIAGSQENYDSFKKGGAWILMPLFPYSPHEHLLDIPGKPPHNPSQSHPMGTDDSGADVLAQLCYGFRVSLSFALVVALLGYGLGIIVGGFMGYYGGWTDIMVQRFIEIWSSIPFLFTIMIIASIVQPSFLILCLLLFMLRSWIGITYYVRGEFYREKAKDYVQAAIGMGATDWSVMIKHILPNSLVPVVTFAPFGIVSYIGMLVSLDYLGFGLPVGTPSWGALLSQGMQHVKHYPHLILITSTAFALTLFAVVMIGEAVREAFDPKVFSRLRWRKKLLEIKGLVTHFHVEEKVAKAVDGVNLHIHENEVFGLVGESGCGKSVTALSILRLIPDPPGKIVAGELLFRGKDMLKLSYADMRKIRGKDISMIFQEPMTSLNPVFSVGWQLKEAVRFHQETVNDKDVEDRAVEMLDLVGIPSARQRLRDYPHQFSGGMRQRVMIAMALACNPALLIADEPTTALDVTIQAQILELMLRVKEKTGDAAILLITHDLAVVAETCHRVAVMYGGKIQEVADIKALFADPLHPYTRGLLRSLPRPELGKQKRLPIIKGIVPNIMDFPPGCKFHTRCDESFDECESREPELLEIKPGHWARCHLCKGKGA
ncbi:oligopeptide/dipeptide ABC transporter ATP-binding protein [Elusimicrobiota bacterium]